MFFPTDTNITLFITDGINSMNYLKKYYAVVYNKLSKGKNIRWNKYMYTDIACFLKGVKYCNYARKSMKIFYLCILQSYLELILDIILKLFIFITLILTKQLPTYDKHTLQTINLMFICLMVFNATFNNISVILWWSVLLVEET